MRPMRLPKHILVLNIARAAQLATGVQGLRDGAAARAQTVDAALDGMRAAALEAALAADARLADRATAVSG